MVSNENKQDMSMEDILASIRRYVSDGQNLPKDESMSVSAKKNSIPVIELTDEVLPTDAVEFKQAAFIEMKKDNNFDSAIVANQRMSTNQQDYLYDRQQLVNDAQAPAYRMFDNNQMFPAARTDPAIRVAPVSASNPFERLQSEVKASVNEHNMQPNLSTNDLLNQMATPLVKSWLDQNLRKIVEEAVEREVQKIRRGL